MGVFPNLRLAIPLGFVMTLGGTSLWAASSVLTNASMSIVESTSSITQQGMVTGAVTVPLMQNIGAVAGSVSLPPPTQLASNLSNVRIGTESLQRSISEVVSRAGLQQASFTIIGDADQVLSIDVPNRIRLQQLSGNGEVDFSPVTSLPGGAIGGNQLVAATDGTGALAFDVGGRVQPSATAAAGDYAGVLKVTVQYN